MITCKFKGRLGNIMFQIATTYAIAQKFGTQAQFAYQPYFEWLPERQTEIQHWFVQNNGKNNIIDPPFKPNMCLDGFFQRHELFDNIKEKLIKEIFKVPEDYYPQTIGMHIRRGDFFNDPINFPIQPKEYYLKALELLNYKNYKVIICTDDIAWAKQNFPLFEIREKTTALDDIYFLANCEALVLSNSTLSFWGAYLSELKRQIIFPLHWFAKESGRTGYEICLKEWKGI
jgi:hypothetical protein